MYTCERQFQRQTMPSSQRRKATFDLNVPSASGGFLPQSGHRSGDPFDGSQQRVRTHWQPAVRI